MRGANIAGQHFNTSTNTKGVTMMEHLIYWYSTLRRESNSLQTAANVRIFSPSQRKVKKSQELSQRGLIHDVNHTHFCDQEVQDTAPGGH